MKLGGEGKEYEVGDKGKSEGRYVHESLSIAAINISTGTGSSGLRPESSA